MEDLARLETEQRNPRTMDLDTLPPPALVATLHAESRAAFDAVEAILPSIAQAVETIAGRLSQGGRLFYVGAGTSGRLGVLDASECPPTFGVSAEMVQGIIAGGQPALTTSIEGAEDDPEAGATDLHARRVAAADVVVGIAASGRTPYVMGALRAAREIGAFTVAVVNVMRPALAACADIVLSAVTGPEALTGSTRLKAGTAQKLILNLLTTAAMVRMGKVYSNLMVDVQATNTKLRDRATRIVMAATGVERDVAEEALSRAGGHCKVAIVMLALGISAEEAARRLQAAGGWVRAVLTSSSKSSA